MIIHGRVKDQVDFPTGPNLSFLLHFVTIYNDERTLSTYHTSLKEKAMVAAGSITVAGVHIASLDGLLIKVSL